MNECPRDDVRDLLPELMHGRLDPVRHADVMRHVAACSACAAELALLRALRAAVTPAPAAVPPVDVDRIALAIADARRSVRPAVTAGSIAPAHRARAVRHHAAWRAAAAIAAVAVGITGWSLVHRQPLPPSAPTAAHAGLVMDGGVSDLPDSDVQELLQSLDSVRAIPDADPAPITYHLGEGVL